MACSARSSTWCTCGTAAGRPALGALDLRRPARPALRGLTCPRTKPAPVPRRVETYESRVPPGTSRISSVQDATAHSAARATPPAVLGAGHQFLRIRWRYIMSTTSTTGAPRASDGPGHARAAPAGPTRPPHPAAGGTRRRGPSLAVWAIAGPLADVELRVHLGPRTEHVGPAAVIIASTLAGLFSWALLALLERFTPRAPAARTATVLVALALSLAGPLSAGTRPGLLHWQACTSRRPRSCSPRCPAANSPADPVSLAVDAGGGDPPASAGLLAARHDLVNLAGHRGSTPVSARVRKKPPQVRSRRRCSPRRPPTAAR